MFTNNADGGANGVTPTTGDVGSGDAFTDIVGPGVAGVLEYTNVQQAHGPLGYRYAVRGTSEQCYLGWDNGSAITDPTYGRCYIFFDTLTASTKVIQWRVTSAGTILGYVTLSATAAVLLRNGQDNATVWTGPTLVQGTWYRIEWSIDPSGGAAQSTVVVRVYPMDSLAVVPGGDSGDQVVSNAGPATDNIQYVRYGQATATTNSPSTTGFVYLDDLIAFATGLPGPTVKVTSLEPIGALAYPDPTIGPF